jgi:DNA-binding transcriptional LysR family regulator
MVQAGLGLGLLPQHAASIIAKGLGLVVRPLDDEWAERQMLICVKKERMANSAVAKLLAHLTRGRA